jgi:hypothetical protein
MAVVPQGTADDDERDNECRREIDSKENVAANAGACQHKAVEVFPPHVVDDMEQPNIGAAPVVENFLEHLRPP